MQRSLMGLFLLALTVGLLALAAGSVRNTLKERWASESRPQVARERVFAVNVITAKRETAYPKIQAFGEIQSRRTLDIRAPISGMIIELSPDFVEGGRVSQGALLIRLDPAEAQSALDVAKTELNEATAERREAATALELAGDELEAARDQVKLRSAALDRQQNLLNRGVGTEAAVETAALAHASAKQAVLAKRQAKASAEARVNRAATSAARQAIRQQDATRRLENTEIHAEFDGVLSTLGAVQGGLVGTNEKIGRLIDPNALEVVFRVSATQFARLIAATGGQTHGKVTVGLDILGLDVTAEGTIERVSAEVGDGQTGRQLFAHLPGETATNFRPGDFVTVQVDEPPLKNVAILPSVSVGADGNILVLGENDRLVEQTVTVLRKQSDVVIVRGRDLIGSEVVQTRSPFLGAGIRVKPVRAENSEITDPELIELSPERRAKLMNFIEENKFIPADRKEKILARLKKDKVPVDMVNRIEARIGG